MTTYRFDRPNMGTRSGHAVAAILGGVVLCVVGIRAAETITDAIGSSFQVCTVQVLTSEERIRDDIRTSSARITKALAAANAATEDKIGALIRELGFLNQRADGLSTAWTVEIAEGDVP